MALVQLLMVDFVDHFVVCPLNALDTADPRNLQPGDPYLTVSKLVDTKGSSLIILVLIIEPFFQVFISPSGDNAEGEEPKSLDVPHNQVGDIDGLGCGPVDDDHQATLDPEADDILDFDQVYLTRPPTPLVDSDGWQLFLEDSVLEEPRQEDPNDPNQAVQGYDYTIVPGNFSKFDYPSQIHSNMYLHLSLIENTFNGLGVAQFTNQTKKACW